jgi:hypothetical protein
MLDLLKNLFDFILLTVVVKIIIGHWLAERILDYSSKLFQSSERNLAIWTHYHEQASQKGHFASSVLVCPEEKCSIFNS